MLVNDGIHLFKFWFSVSREEQLRRFISRRDDPLKHWKLSPIDIQSLDRWDEYTEAKNQMFFHTHTGDAPWTVIKSDDKKRARLNCIRFFLHSLDYPGKDLKAIRPTDDKIVLVPNAHSKSGRLDSVHDCIQYHACISNACIEKVACKVYGPLLMCVRSIRLIDWPFAVCCNAQKTAWLGYRICVPIHCRTFAQDPRCRGWINWLWRVGSCKHRYCGVRCY